MEVPFSSSHEEGRTSRRVGILIGWVGGIGADRKPEFNFGEGP